MRLAKKGWMILVLAILVSLIPLSLFSLNLPNAKAGVVYDCFIASEQDCAAIEAESQAEAEQLCKDNSGELTSGVDNKCVLGCCCLWKPLFESYQAETGYRKGSCNLNTDNLFFPETEVLGTTMCQQKCQTLTQMKNEEGVLPACSDNQDNDGDGLTDSSDPDCLSPEDNTEEPSATESECKNTIDDDGDNLIDSYTLYESADPGVYKDYLDEDIYPDPCCTKELGVSESCSYEECKVGSNSQLCSCGGNICGFPWLIKNSPYNNDPAKAEKAKETFPYITGSFCCNGQCSFEPCGACIEGQQTFVTTPEGKKLYTCVCKEDEGEEVCEYTFEADVPVGLPEYCIDATNNGFGSDEDKDKKPNCLDTDCFGVKCSNVPLGQKDANGEYITPKTCSIDISNPDYASYQEYIGKIPQGKAIDVAYYDEDAELWKCCFPDPKGKSKVNDCNNDDVPETCGSCECLSLHKEAQMLKAQHVLGKAAINLSYYFACQQEGITLKVIRCKGTPAVCGVNPITNSVTLGTSSKFSDIAEQLECDYINKEGDMKSSTDLSNEVECLGEDGILQPGMNIDAVSLYDTNIQNKTDYTYIIKSSYPDGTVVFSDAAHIKTGHQMCFSKSGHFCIRDPKFHPDSSHYKYYCDDLNVLHGGPLDTDKTLKCADNEMCVETPTGAGLQTQCTTLSPCIFCGSPFNMYGVSPTFEASTINLDTYPDDFMGLSEGDFIDDCKLSPLCYYDYTNTIKDAYESCEGVSTCFDYRSQRACDQDTTQTANGDVNNKCLTHDCQWSNLNDPFKGILEGICYDEDVDAKGCELCNELENNKIFTACNLTVCKAFQTNTHKCYLDVNNKCVSDSHLTCSVYTSEEDCINSASPKQNIDVNIEYDDSGINPIWGDNKIIAKSNDYLGFGLCKWHNQLGCFKDADGDGKKDIVGQKASDHTPPVTEVITPANSDHIELNFSVQDPIVPDRYNSPADKVKTYYCFPSDNPLPEKISTNNKYSELWSYNNFPEYNVLTEKEVGHCYPDNLYMPNKEPETPAGNGYHTVFFYSVDEANNVEEVKSFTFNVDIKPPEITITPYLTLDQAAPYDSSVVLFAVELDEPAKLCHDIFEDASQKQINLEGGQYFQAKYENLKDGSYLYTVVCTDLLDNTINKSITLVVDADQEIQAPMPKGVIDYSPINLEVVTLKNGECRFGSSSNFDVLTSFGTPQQISTNPVMYKYSYPMSLDDQGVYKFKVMCKFPTFGSAPREDEIQFVYDITPPKTRLTDSNKNDFNLSKWYTGDYSGEMAYLECNDEPEFGFGCNETHYCIAQGAVKCPTFFDDKNKQTSHNVYLPLVIPETPEEQWLCFQSNELTEASYGGLVEQKSCVKLLVDSSQGPLIDVPLLKQNTDLANPYTYYSSQLTKDMGIDFEITGEVIDADAATSPPDNKLSIKVFPLDDEYVTGILSLIQGANQDPNKLAEAMAQEELSASEEFEDIAANSAFSQTLVLSPGLNKIELVAQDRSGEWSQPYTYYVVVSAFNGELLEIIEPPKGVSSKKEFDLVIETSESLPIPEKCALSTNKNIGFGIEMQKEQGRQFKTHINFPGMTEGVYYTLFAKCDFPGGISDQKQIEIVWDSSAPAINKTYIVPSDGKVPPTVVEPPLFTNITAVTDDKTRCKYSTTPGKSYFSMTPFDDYETKNLTYINQQKITNIADGKEYKYYIKCDNGPTEPASEHISNEAEIVFRVNLSMFTGMELMEPEPYTSATTINFELHTTKQATDCTFGSSEDTMDQYIMKTLTEGEDAFKIHTGGPIVLGKGEHTYYFNCLTGSEGYVSDNFKFTIDLTPPVVIVKTAPYTTSLDTLTASWEAEDEYSEIETFNVSIGTEPGKDDIYEWNEIGNDKKTITKLNLTNQTTYYWNVVALNSVGLWSQVASNETYVDTSYDPGFTFVSNVDPCDNNVLDLGESDIDCGGECSSCTDGKNCDIDEDCASGHCISGICISASCSDSILNQQESDIDCGGTCSPCQEGMSCNIDSDCDSEYCAAGSCSVPTCDDGVQNGDEQGVDCGGGCMEQCAIPSGDEEETCDDGIKNQDEEGIDCGGSCGACDKAPTTQKPATEESSLWWIWLLILLLIGGIGAGGYYYYTSIFIKEKQPFMKGGMGSMNKQRPQSQPNITSNIQTRSRPQPRGFMPKLRDATTSWTSSLFTSIPKEERQRKFSEKNKQRSRIFDVFGSAENKQQELKLKERPQSLAKETKPEQKAERQEPAQPKSEQKRETLKQIDEIKSVKTETKPYIKSEPKVQKQETPTKQQTKPYIEKKPDKEAKAQPQEKPTFKASPKSLSALDKLKSRPDALKQLSAIVKKK